MKTRILASLFAVTLALPLCLASCNLLTSNELDSIAESLYNSQYNEEANAQQAILESFQKNNSALLYDLLTDDYYNYLINLVKTNRLSSKSYIAPHPFAFLEEQGHDVNRVRSGALDCTTHTFTKDEEPNKLYMAVYVENDGEYYTEYLLRYTLTEKEMSDYKMLFDKRTIQAAFINDQISKSKTPEILSEINLKKYCHDNYLSNDKFAYMIHNTLTTDRSVSYDLILKDYDIDNDTFSIMMFTYHRSNDAPTIRNDKNYIATEITLKARLGEQVKFENGVVTIQECYIDNCEPVNPINTLTKDKITYFATGMIPSKCADLTTLELTNSK